MDELEPEREDRQRDVDDADDGHFFFDIGNPFGEILGVYDGDANWDIELIVN